MAAYIDTFVRYSDRNAEGGFIRANGDYSFTMSDHPARVHNARLESIDFATHGFKLVKHATDVDFANAEDVQKRWYPEACRIIKALTGAREVYAFMGILRGGDENLGGGPALSALVDFNEPALRGWVKRLAADRADEFADTRLMNVNLWRGTRPVRCSPLAVCDARSVAKGDFMPDMEPDEVLAFRLFDTANQDWHMTAHTAIVDPTAPPDAPKRQSYELRTLAVFD